MDDSSVAPVVVGVKDTASALPAVRQAVQEAVLRERPLRVVHAFRWPLYELPRYAELRGEAESIVREAVRAAAAWGPRTPVSGQVVDGAPRTVLLHEARTAALLVLGGGKMASRTCMPVDSVLVQVAARARCPVMVAYPTGQATGPVLVGVDGSPHADGALAFAVDEAARLGVDLVAVYAEEPWPAGYLPPADGVTGQLAQALARCRAEYPGLGIFQRRIDGDPDRALVQESAGAQLIVVGARGARGHFQTLLGKVSQALLHHASCPVVIVHNGQKAATVPPPGRTHSLVARAAGRLRAVANHG